MNNDEHLEPRTGLEIAIIGMSGRFPGARNINEFWENLKNGVESITFFSDDELTANGVSPFELNHPDYVKAGAVLEDIEYFDADFFGVNPKEAEIMDPQQRIFLETAWEALENAGYDPFSYQDPIGVYAGVSMNTYVRSFSSGMDFSDSTNLHRVVMANEKDYLSSRVSYKLNLTGPSVVVQCACSTSLVAVHLACRALLSGECNMALTGGVSAIVPQNRGYFFQEGAIFSPDGHCRAFDARAKGTIGGSGVGVVLLKRLEDALSDKDYIHAIIRGTAINNDGSVKVGYSAPSVSGQAKVIEAAQIMAEVDPETISYVEAHGTGTPMGDPIEMAALKQVFQASTDKKRFCAVGSVKTNIGHLDVASGVTGLIKTVMALEHELIPTTIHFEQPNPEIDFANSPFFVCDAPLPWKKGATPRRAGVSSFGIGGTNAHAILEEAPLMEAPTASRPYQLLLLSAKTGSALESANSNLIDYLRQHNEINLPDVAYTLQVGRRAFEHRRMVVCRNVADATAALETRSHKRVFTGRADTGAPPVAFAFSGQGAQYTNMGLSLYETEPVFKEQVDNCAELLKPHLGLDLRSVLYPSGVLSGNSKEQLDQTSITQPALFTLEYSLARLWMKWGIQPRAMIGHSIGEYVAACLAGVFSLEDALALIAARGRLMQSMPAGAMLALHLSEDEAQQFLNEDLCVAAVNGPSSCTVSGPTPAIEELEKRLERSGIEVQRLRTSHAFHSSMMEPAVKQFIEAMSMVSLNAPTIPFISNVSGTWITEAEATDPRYWANHLRAAVRFGEGIAELLKEPRRLLLEVGPGTALTSLIKQNHTLNDGQQALASLRHPKSQQSDSEALLNTLGKLWLAGAQVEWHGFYQHEQRQRLPLPSYPFERQRYWVKPQQYAANNNQLVRGKKRDVEEWFYVPGWKRSLPTVVAEGEDWSEANGCWLIFTDVCGLGSDVVKELQLQCQDAVTVAAGNQFAKLNDHAYVINPGQRDDYFLLLEELRTSGKSLNKIIHLWSVTGNDNGHSFEQYQEQGFYSLLWLAQAIGEKGISDPVELAVVSTNVQEVNGEEAVRPEKATVLGPCKVISKEYPNITCRSIDVSLGEPGTVQQQRIVEQVIGELRAKRPETVVAYRGKHRWVESFEQVRLTGDGKERGRLREGGVYIITGGLGGIGFMLAEYLVKTVSAKLVLIGRTALPEQEPWQASDRGEDEVSSKMMKVRALTELGAEVLVVSADVTDRQQMHAAVREAYERFGEIHGVIHAAGVAGGGVIQLKTEEAAASVLAPKVKGALVLEDIFKDAKLDFLVLCSSILSVLSEFGQVDYCAANAFLDAFAQSTKSSTFTVSINWDIWREAGMGANAAVPASLKRLYEESLEEGILSAEGTDAFRRVLDCSSPQVIISVEDLQARIERHKAFAASSLLEELDKSDLPQPAYSRPELDNPYIAPTNGVEQIIADVWQRILGIKQVGIHDNFFELGGDSILSIQVVASVRRAGLHLTTQQLFEHQTISELARVADSSATAVQVETSPAASVIDNHPDPQAGRDRSQGFPRVNISQSELEALFGKTNSESIEDIYPLTPLQQGMLFHVLAAPSSGLYVNQQRYTLQGSLDISALKTAFQQVIDRHQILRTAFILASHGEPLQVVYRHLDIPWGQYDWRDQSQFSQQEKMEALLRADRENDFDLSVAPMMRMALVQMQEDFYEFIWSFHLMLLDGWSVPLVLKEVLTFYDAICRGQQIELDPPVLYGDYIDWLQQQDRSEAEAYWRKTLVGFTMPTSLGGDRAPAGLVDQQEDYTEKSLLLDEATTATLRSFTGQHQLTLNTLLQGAWALILNRRSGADDVAFGSVVSGRPGDFPGVESTVGLFINTLPVRVRISSDASLLPWLKALQTQQAEARRFEFCSLVDIQGWSDVPRGQSLFESVLIFQNTPADVSLLDQDRLKVIDIRNRERITYPITLVVEPGSRLHLKIVFNHRRFDDGTITRMIEQVQRCLMEMVADPEAVLSSLSTKTKIERKLLIDSFNQSLEAY